MMFTLRLKQRISILSETAKFICLIRMEIEYTGANVQTLIEKAVQSGSCEKLDFLKQCLIFMKNDASFHESWQKAVNVSRLPFKAEESKKLIEMGDFLGTTDLKSQITMLRLYDEYFSGFYKDSLADYRKYGNLWGFIGVAFGFGVFILIV